MTFEIVCYYYRTFSTGENRDSFPGFTLIELTVVLFLISLFMLIAMPKLGNFIFHSDLKSVARSIKADIVVLRSKSISSHEITSFNIDLDNRTYWGEIEGEVAAENESKEMIALKRLPDGVRFMDAYNINTPKTTTGILKSIINPKGVIEETIIHLSDEEDKVLTIIINAYTGRFTIYDKYVDVEYGG